MRLFLIICALMMVTPSLGGPTLHPILQVVLDTIRGFFGKCVHTCPKGQYPVQNIDFKKSYNGCGSGKFIIHKHLHPSKQFETCCNEHDLCYDSCTSEKTRCDKEAYECLLKTCDDKFNVLSAPEKLACQGISNIFDQTLKRVGCAAYLDAQRNSCVCK